MKRIIILTALLIINISFTYSQVDAVQFCSRIVPILDTLGNYEDIEIIYLMKLTDVKNTQKVFVYLETAQDKADLDALEFTIQLGKEGYYAFNKELGEIPLNGWALVIPKKYKKDMEKKAEWVSMYVVDMKGTASKKQYYNNNIF